MSSWVKEYWSPIVVVISRSLRLLDGIEHVLGIEAVDRLQNTRIEDSADHCCRPENPGRGFLQPLQTPPDDETNAFGNVELRDGNPIDPVPVLVEEPLLFPQVLEHLFHEERVPFGLSVDHVNERARRRATGKALDELGRGPFRKPAQRDAMAEALTNELGQDALERPADV